MSGDPDRDLADARIAAAAERRRRQRRSLRILEEETTFASLLTETCRRGDEVAIDTMWGARHLGCLLRVSAEVVVLEPVARRVASESDAVETPPIAASIILRHEAIAAFGVHSGDRSSGGVTTMASGAGTALSTVTLGEILAELADRDADVTIRAGGVSLNGRVRSVGLDVVTLGDSSKRPARYVRVDSVSEISVSSWA